MKKLILCLLILLSFTSSYTEDQPVLIKAIDTFIATQVVPLVPEEQQIFANVVFLSLNLAQLDCHTYKNMHNSTVPLADSADYEQVTRISIAAQTKDSIEEQCQKAFDVAAEIAQSEVNLQEVSVIVFKTYYKALYAQLTALAPEHRTILFNESGIIPVEQRTEQLPLVS